MRAGLVVALLAAIASSGAAAAGWAVDGVVGGTVVLEALGAVGRTGGPGGDALRATARAVADSTVFVARTDAGGRITGACTGSLVHPEVVLTAAHCAVGAPNLVVLFGADVRGGQVPGQVERRKVIDRAVHRDYRRAVDHAGRTARATGRKGARLGLDSTAWDLALLLLHRPAPAAVRPVRLAPEGFRDSPAVPKVIAGFGLHEGPGSAAEGLLRFAEVRGSTRAYRGDWDGDANVLETRSGADGIRVNTCYGDSGGPVFARRADGLLQIAVTSAGDGRCREVALSSDIGDERAALREMFRYLTGGTPAAGENPF